MTWAVPALGAFGQDYIQTFKERRAAHSAKTFEQHMDEYNERIKRLTKDPESGIVITRVKNGKGHKVPKYCVTKEIKK